MKGMWEEREAGGRNSGEFRAVPELDVLDREERAGWGDLDWDQAAAAFPQAPPQLNVPFQGEGKGRKTSKEGKTANKEGNSPLMYFLTIRKVPEGSTVMSSSPNPS